MGGKGKGGLLCRDSVLWEGAPLIHTVDGRNPAPPKKPCNDDSPVNTNKRYGFNHGFKVVRTDLVHPQYLGTLREQFRCPLEMG